ncbi:hypothetical protein ABB02_01288 [Clostridiaceae bacterium JG1575]|nr:hypothetical protein ABB02_01288 [Clostridiaceae bacterium JG1575]
MEDFLMKIDPSYRHRASGFEKVFGKVALGAMRLANPFKKFAFKTPCLMHRFINIKAVHILEAEGYYEAADFYRDHIRPLNEGATWIDQDFKSIHHFYHYKEQKGLFGFSDALTQARRYRDQMMEHARNKNLTRALFYTGVICHLMQDMTVPQHIGNHLLNAHREYEVWILSKSWDTMDFTVERGIKRYPRFDLYLQETARFTQRCYEQSLTMDDREEAFQYLATTLIARAQHLTAGLLLDLYEGWFSTLDKSMHEKRQALRKIKEGTKDSINEALWMQEVPKDEDKKATGEHVDLP